MQRLTEKLSCVGRVMNNVKYMYTTLAVKIKSFMAADLY